MKTENEIKNKIELMRKRKIKYYGELYNRDIETYILALRWVLKNENENENEKGDF